MVERIRLHWNISSKVENDIPIASPSLGKNFGWVVLGNTAYSLCQWGILVLLARFGGATMVGTFSLGLATTAPVMMLASLQLRPVLATDVIEAFEFGEYLGLRLLTTGLALAATAVLIVWTGYTAESAWTTMLIAAGRGLESVSEIVHGLLQRHECMDRIGKSMLIRGFVVLSTMAGALHVTRSVVWASVAFALTAFILLVLYDIPSGIWIQKTRKVSGGIRPIWTFNRLVQLARTVTPLGVVGTLTSLNGNVPRYVVTWYAGRRELGIFSGITYVLIALGNGASSLGQAVAPRLAKQFAARQQRDFGILVLKMLGFGLIIGSVGVFVTALYGHSILRLLYGGEYASYNDAFVWTMTAAGFWCLALFLGFAATAARQFFAQIPLLLAVVAATYVASTVLVMRGGIVGAAQATTIGFAVQTVGGLVICGLALAKQHIQARTEDRNAICASVE
jgi:O-antigen/teichoic acid export membrane protein